MRGATLNATLAAPATLEFAGGVLTLAASTETDVFWNGYELATLQPNTPQTLELGAGLLRFEVLVDTQIVWGRFSR